MITSTDTTTPLQEVPSRNAIADEYKWNLSLMYVAQPDWERHYGELEKMIDELAGLRGSAGQSAQTLHRILALRDQLNVQLEKLQAYAAMKHHEDMREAGPQALDQRASTLTMKYAEATAWLQPELLEISESVIGEWLREPSLKIYEHYFDDLWRSKSHILSPREEELLAMSRKAAGAAGETYSLLTNAELKLRTMKIHSDETVEISPGVFYQMLYSKDRQERQDAYLGYMQSYLEIKNSLASTLAGAVERDWFYAKARHYASCLEASLDAENLPISVYHNLIQTVQKHLPLLHRYTALKKKWLKLDELHPYDLYVTPVDITEKRYTYEQGRDLILSGLEPMGSEYMAVLRKAFASGWVDVFETKGKRSGAYNMGTYLSPPYVLLNFNGTYNDVSTIAHEMGHAMQSYFSQKHQPPVYAGYPMFTAEVASTTAEIVLKHFLMEQTSDRNERAWMIGQMLENIRTTVFRQTRFSEFDLAIHQMAEQGQPLTADELMKLSRDLFQKYYGPALVLDPESDIEGLRIPHFYTNFYVYRYATSFSAATAIARRIMNKEQQTVERFMEFLKIGHSRYAIDMLKIAGVDMTTPQPVEDCMALFEELMNQLDRLLAG